LKRVDGTRDVDEVYDAVVRAVGVATANLVK
jgi:hypothetical protein